MEYGLDLNFKAVFVRSKEVYMKENPIETDCCRGREDSDVYMLTKSQVDSQ